MSRAPEHVLKNLGKARGRIALGRWNLVGQELIVHVLPQADPTDSLVSTQPPNIQATCFAFHANQFPKLPEQHRDTPAERQNQSFLADPRPTSSSSGRGYPYSARLYV